jgi:hypothetical protein
VVSKFVFKWVNVCRYASDDDGLGDSDSDGDAGPPGFHVGLYNFTHSLKAAWFQPLNL